MLSTFWSFFFRSAMRLRIALRFELGLTGSAHADADTARLPRKVRPGAGEAGEHVFELRNLDLDLGFGCARMLGEDIEDDTAAIHDLHLEDLFKLFDLGSGKIFVEQDDIGFVLFH